jgi:hypothetical protein
MSVPLAHLIAASHGRWLPRVVPAVLRTDDAVAVAETLNRAVGDAVGVPVVGATFYEPGVGIVAGLELADGRAVVAKVHRASFASQERLAAIVDVQADLARAGLPAPAPVAGPVALGEGWLTVEALLVGDGADGYDAGARDEMAVALHGFVAAARPHAGDARLGSWPGAPEVAGLWPQPHDLRFDLGGTGSGAKWIDDAARTARATLTAAGQPVVVGHLDWRVQNLAFSAGRVSAIYDWDSIHLVPEPALVGSASVVHPVDWRLDLPDPLPSLDQVDGFVETYESARGAPFDDDERAAVAAGQRWAAAYGARCQHSDHVLGLFPDVDHSRGWPRLLRQLLGR